jgi:uncharacterized protein YdhG (YjbR/CyaY superfamily)
MAKPPRNIDEYLKGVTTTQRAALQKLRQQILTLAPDATECISYSMPAFRAQGKVVAGFLATTKGCSFFPFSGTTLDSMAADLTGYSRTKSALHFDPERGLPSTLLRKLLRTRRAELGPLAKAEEQTAATRVKPRAAKSASKKPVSTQPSSAKPRAKKTALAKTPRAKTARGKAR